MFAVVLGIAMAGSEIEHGRILQEPHGVGDHRRRDNQVTGLDDVFLHRCIVAIPEILGSAFILATEQVFLLNLVRMVVIGADRSGSRSDHRDMGDRFLENIDNFASGICKSGLDIDDGFVRHCAPLIFGIGDRL